MNNPIINSSSEESSNTAANAAKVDVVTDHIENIISLTSCYWYLASLYYRTPGWYDNYNNKCDDSDCIIISVIT